MGMFVALQPETFDLAKPPPLGTQIFHYWPIPDYLLPTYLSCYGIIENFPAVNFVYCGVVPQGYCTTPHTRVELTGSPNCCHEQSHQHELRSGQLRYR